MTVERVCQAVSEALDFSLSELRRAGRRRRLTRGRAIAGYVGRLVGRIPLARTAETLGRDRSTLARDVGRLESALARNRSDRELVQQIVQSLNKQPTAANAPSQH